MKLYAELSDQRVVEQRITTEMANLKQTISNNQKAMQVMEASCKAEIEKMTSEQYSLSLQLAARDHRVAQLETELNVLKPQLKELDDALSRAQTQVKSPQPMSRNMNRIAGEKIDRRTSIRN